MFEDIGGKYGESIDEIVELSKFYNALHADGSARFCYELEHAGINFEEIWYKCGRMNFLLDELRMFSSSKDKGRSAYVEKKIYTLAADLGIAGEKGFRRCIEDIKKQVFFIRNI